MLGSLQTAACYTQGRCGYPQTYPQTYDTTIFLHCQIICEIFMYFSSKKPQGIVVLDLFPAEPHPKAPIKTALKYRFPRRPEGPEALKPAESPDLRRLPRQGFARSTANTRPPPPKRRTAPEPSTALPAQSTPAGQGTQIS